MTTKLKIIDYVNKVQNFILWQYRNNTLYKNKFWKHAADLYKKHNKEDIEKIIAIVKDMSEENVRKSIQDNDVYAQWQKWNFKIFYDNTK
jgi:hypothetical protein